MKAAIGIYAISIKLSQQYKVNIQAVFRDLRHRSLRGVKGVIILGLFK